MIAFIIQYRGHGSSLAAPFLQRLSPRLPQPESLWCWPLILCDKARLTVGSQPRGVEWSWDQDSVKAKHILPQKTGETIPLWMCTGALSCWKWKGNDCIFCTSMRFFVLSQHKVLSYSSYTLDDMENLWTGALLWSLLSTATRMLYSQ